MDHFAPKAIANSIPVADTEASKQGVHYIAANGSEIKNFGEKCIKGTTEKGSPIAMTWQIAGVEKSLASLGRICDAGNVAVFIEKGVYIVGKSGAKHIIEAVNHCGEDKMKMNRENGVYNFKIKIPAEG